jgi:hypothetical protein
LEVVISWGEIARTRGEIHGGDRLERWKGGRTISIICGLKSLGSITGAGGRVEQLDGLYILANLNTLLVHAGKVDESRTIVSN